MHSLRRVGMGKGGRRRGVRVLGSGDACSSAARRCAPRLCGSNGCQLTSTSRRRRRCSIPSDSYSFPGVAVNPLHACQAPERQAQRRLRPQPEGQENAQPPPHQARG